MNKCLSCQKEVKLKYCNPQCQNDFQYKNYIKKWLSGGVSGVRGKTQTSRHIKRYLIELHGAQCQYCGWGKTNPHTNTIPIELSHKDGDFTNNVFENLELICPNCHALTGSYKGANKKTGRPRSKYYRGL
jgi:hypothetical protein